MKGMDMAILIDSSKMLDLLGDNGERWTQGAWGDEQSMCLHGAIRRCQPQPGDAYLVEQVACHQGWGTDWNDDTSTTWPMVRERLARIEITDADLADTFGPQWEHIVALVRRSAVLTADEAQRMVAVRAAAGAAGAARVANAAQRAAWAARNAARDAARNAALGAAWRAAWVAGEGAAWAARNAVGVLVVRDLIGKRGFTQDRYDTLTRPWRTVIGPVHPDDRIDGVAH
jgi:hypothetical protein